jgi:hypothetical protein
MSRQAAGDQRVTRPESVCPRTGVGVPPGTVFRTQCATDPRSLLQGTGVGVPPGTVLRTQCAPDIYRPVIGAARIGVIYDREILCEPFCAFARHLGYKLFFWG